jgi:transposase
MFSRTFNIDYHVEVEGHYSSVPYVLVRQQLDVRLSAHVVEIFHKGTRVASHQRAPLKGRHSTVAAPMPKAHQYYAEWTPHRLMLWAAKTGEATAQVVETMLASRPHPQQGFRACLGLMRLGKRSGDGRLEAAGHRAIRIGACSYKRIASILKPDLDRQPLPGPPAAAPVMTHGNIRGAQYSHPHQGDPTC